MTTETAVADTPTQDPAQATNALNAAIDAENGANNDTPADDKPKEAEQPKQKTPEEREIARLRRANSRLLQQRAELRARNSDAPLTREPIARDNGAPQSDNETLSLSRQELNDLIDKEARKLAPQIKQQETEIEHRRAIVAGLAKEWGKEKFDALASELDDAFDGLVDDNGRPKPAADAIFESEDARALIEYLADPDHADEAEAIGRLSAVAAGRAITKLEAKLAADKAKDKPQPSKVAAPIEQVRGAGVVNSLPNDTDSVETWVKKERARLEAGRKGRG